MNTKQWYANTGYTPYRPYSENVQVNNGALKLIAKKEFPQIHGYYTNWDNNPSTQDDSYFEYSSARIDTKYKFGYGWYEARCKIPKGKGFWPAFWTFAGNPWNEIDIFEFWNPDLLSNLSRVLHMTTHYDYDNDGQNEYCSVASHEVNLSTDFHIYGVEWTPYRISWYLDGVLKRTTTHFETYMGQLVDCNSLSAGSYLMTNWFPKDPMYIIFNFAIQNNDNNNPDNSTPFPSQLEVDWVRYFEKKHCQGDIVIDSLSDVNEDPNFYNVVFGNNVSIENSVDIQENQFLEVIATHQIILKPGFYTHGGVFKGIISSGVCEENQGFTTTQPKGMLNKQADLIKQSNKELQQMEIDDSIFAEESIFSVYPNPASEKITLHFFNNQRETYSIFITDVLGRTVYRGQSDTSLENKKEIDVSKLEKGTYEVALSGKDKLYKQKIIIY
jgi:beta-glucanase (GH16 family)